MIEFTHFTAEEQGLLRHSGMSLIALVPAVVACVLFVETLNIRPSRKH